jgi:hypothetical protein
MGSDVMPELQARGLEFVLRLSLCVRLSLYSLVFRSSPTIADCGFRKPPSSDVRVLSSIHNGPVHIIEICHIFSWQIFVRSSQRSPWQ